MPLGDETHVDNAQPTRDACVARASTPLGTLGAYAYVFVRFVFERARNARPRGETS